MISSGKLTFDEIQVREPKPPLPAGGLIPVDFVRNDLFEAAEEEYDEEELRRVLQVTVIRGTPTVGEVP